VGQFHLLALFGLSVIFIFVPSSPLHLPTPSLHKIFTSQTLSAFKLRLFSEC